MHRFLAPVLTALALAACGDGKPGDLARIPPPTSEVRGDGARLSDLNDPAKPRPPQSSEVYVTGVTVLEVDRYDETSNGSSSGNIYAQDLPVAGEHLPYSGITLFNVSFSPPTLRVAPGDVVDIRGAYEEFPGPASSPFEDGKTLPEIVGGTISLRFEGQSPPPRTIALEDLANYQTGRQWIGMLVRLENVVAQSPGFKATSGRFSVRLDVPGMTGNALPAINNAFFDLEGSGLPFAQGTTYKEIIGVVQYFYSFTISPRSAADIVL
ncbi:MAG: hypothetical protein KF718_18230 [Polyangiaceae bacterium]|nr:hypothetical protein [Polyangiaceae bacterium]